MGVALLRERRRDRRAGRARTPATRAARRRFAMGVSWLDFKLGLRMLARYPGITVIGGVAMAFGIAMGAGAFQFFRDAAYPRLPYEGGDNLVRVFNMNTRTSLPDARTARDLEVWRSRLRSVTDLGAFSAGPRNLSLGQDDTAPVRAVAITASAFGLVKVPPLLGRPLLPTDDGPRAPPVAVIGYDLWQGRFGGDADIVGRIVHLGDEATTIVGVMPRGFEFPASFTLWTPLHLDATAYEPGSGPALAVLGRLAPGATLERAQAEVATMGERLAEVWPESHGELVARVNRFPPTAVQTGGVMSMGGILALGALFLMALMALVCANVALLLFARAAAREGEIAVRSALGASRGRIVGQLFAEALALAAVALVIGLPAGSAALGWVLGIASSSGEPFPFWFHQRLDPATVGYAVLLALVGASIAGVLPGLKITGGHAQGSLQRLAGRGSGSRLGRLWSGIIVTQVALTVMFVPVVLWLGAETWKIRTADPGFAATEFLSAELALDGGEAFGSGEEAAADPVFGGRFRGDVQELERRLAAEPGVLGVAVATQLPGAWHERRPVEVDAPNASYPDEWGNRAQLVSVAPGFFRVLGMDVVAGRGFDEGDAGSGERVVVVNESFVREFLGGRNAVGARLRYTGPGAASGAGPDPEEAGDWYRIVGVVRDVVMTIDPDLPHNAGIYHHLSPREAYSLKVAVHLSGDPTAFAGRLRTLASAVDPELRVDDPISLDQADRATLAAYDAWFRVVVVAGVLAMLLTNAGIFSIISYTVARRTREIGVRVALGADRRQVVTAVAGRMARLVATGVLVGSMLLALVVFAASEGTLEPTPTRGALLLAHTLVMTLVCLLACVVPTRRALKIEPAEALAADG